jgi:hypothetical protein
MNVMIDRAALEKAKEITGKSTYSETINHAVGEIVRAQKVRDAFEFFSTDWWDGDLETLMAMREGREIPVRRQRIAAKTAHATQARKKHRGARR